MSNQTISGIDINQASPVEAGHGVRRPDAAVALTADQAHILHRIALRYPGALSSRASNKRGTAVTFFLSARGLVVGLGFPLRPRYMITELGRHSLAEHPSTAIDTTGIR